MPLREKNLQLRHPMDPNDTHIKANRYPSGFRFDFIFARKSEPMEQKQVRKRMRWMIILEITLYVAVLASAALFLYSSVYL